MVYHAYKHKPSTAPRYSHQPAQLCKVKSVRADDVMKALVHALKLYMEDFEIKADNLPDMDEATIQGQLDALQNEQRKIERKLSRLFEKWEDEKITDNEFVERKAIHNARIEAIKQQMDEIENSIPEKEEYEEMIISLSEAMETLLDDSFDAEVKNEYLKQIIEKIEFSRENGEEFIIDLYLK